MSDYTPQTVSVRNAYAIGDNRPGERYPVPVRGQAFDRWLTAHDAKVRADTLEEAAAMAESYHARSAMGVDYGTDSVAQEVADMIRALETTPTPTAEATK